jgi:hypothetical protein
VENKEEPVTICPVDANPQMDLPAMHSLSQLFPNQAVALQCHRRDGECSVGAFPIIRNLPQVRLFAESIGRLWCKFCYNV